MPTIYIRTNVKTLPAGIHEKLVDLMVELFHKDKKYMVTLIDVGAEMRFGGSNDPCAVVQLGAIGLGTEHNAAYSKKIADLLLEKFHISGDRHYVLFTEMQRENVGHNGTTFAVAK